MYENLCCTGPPHFDYKNLEKSENISATTNLSFVDQREFGFILFIPSNYVQHIQEIIRASYIHYDRRSAIFTGVQIRVSHGIQERSKKPMLCRIARKNTRVHDRGKPKIWGVRRAARTATTSMKDGGGGYVVYLAYFRETFH